MSVDPRARDPGVTRELVWHSEGEPAGRNLHWLRRRVAQRLHVALSDLLNRMRREFDDVAQRYDARGID